MAVKVTIPNVKQNLTNPNGQCSKAWFDFFRLLFERTGGDNDNIADDENEIQSFDTLIYVRRGDFDALVKRVIALEKEISQLGC